MSLDLSYERVIAAAPERVFAAFTSPAGQHAFYGRDDPGWIVESDCDLRIGGVWSIAFGPSRGELYHHRSVLLAIDRPHRIAMRTTETRLDGSTLSFDVEFTFAPAAGGTRMTMRQSGFPTDVLRDEHARGVPDAFDQLVRTLERSPMSRSVLYMSMSLDGFIAGPDDDRSLGRGGERLHAWLGEGEDPKTFRPTGVNGQVFDEMLATGAVLTGRRTFDAANQWAGDHHDGVEIFVPTRGEPGQPASDLVHYVTDGIESAMAQAKAAAGDRAVMVHGAFTARTCLEAGVLDDLEIHLVPYLLGAGRPLVGTLGHPRELELTRVLEGDGVTHLHYRVTP